MSVDPKQLARLIYEEMERDSWGTCSSNDFLPLDEEDRCGADCYEDSHYVRDSNDDIVKQCPKPGDIAMESVLERVCQRLAEL